MLNINRDSHNEKILGLLSQSPKLIDEMCHLASLSRQWFVFSNTRLNIARDFSTFLAVAINLIILFTWERDVSETVSYLTKLDVF